MESGKTMNFQQLRFVRAAVRNDMNLTAAASALFTSQSGVSKQIKDLETELGVEIFIRRGKRLTGLTPAGKDVLQMIERILTETENLKSLSSQYGDQDSGRLVIATTHNQAMYTLPPFIKAFMDLYPKVTIELREGTPNYVARTTINGTADFAVASEMIDQFPELKTYPCFSWRHTIVVPHDHPLTGEEQPSLANVAKYPIITYNNEFTGRSNINAAFARQGLTPDIRLTAIDADVIKTYVALGLGVGIVAEMATKAPNMGPIVALNGYSQFFDPCTTKIGIRRNALLHPHAYRFIELYAPHLKQKELTKSMTSMSGRVHA
jgi:LysR family transcriptional regulator, cys regulon transcriptional activator